MIVLTPAALPGWRRSLPCLPPRHRALAVVPAARRRGGAASGGRCALEGDRIDSAGHAGHAIPCAALRRADRPRLKPQLDQAVGEIRETVADIAERSILRRTIR